MKTTSVLVVFLLISAGTLCGQTGDSLVPLAGSWGSSGGDGAWLGWSVFSETGCSGYYVQRALDPDNQPPERLPFQRIPNSYQPCQGTIFESYGYSYHDTSVPTGFWWYRLEQVRLDGTSRFALLSGMAVWGTSDVAEHGELPAEYALRQNYPNPFNPSTTIRYELPKTSAVTLTVYDILGRQVSELVNERRDAGVHEVKFDASGLASGVYYYRLQAGSFVETRKLLLIR